MMDRILTFAGKTRQRGPSYVRDLVTYHALATGYRLGGLSRRFNANSMPGAAPRPAFHFAQDDVSAIVAAVPKSIRQAALLEAGQYVERRFSFRGLEEVHFAGAIDWNLTPEGNTSWSWDLNRHRFFLTLGTAHHYAGGSPDGSAFKDKLIQFWADWMHRNPPNKGQNWRSPFEVAARLRNWIWAYFLLVASPEVSPLFLHKAWRGLRAHAAHLASHLEYHWPNNHLLLEALSLHEFAVVFQGHGGELYLPLASRVLQGQVQQQILRDGVHSELCPMYHNIAASELGAFSLLCRQLGHALPLATEERIFSMRRFSAALRRSDGSTPLLGDSSFPDTCLRFDAGPYSNSDLAYWLHRGKPPAVEPALAAAERPLSLELFDEAGYGVLRSASQQTHLTFDFGQFSRCAAANHGHSDALSFELHAAGHPWIVDSGFFHSWKDDRGDLARKNNTLKSGNPDWTRYFRCTAAHNTLIIDGREQNEFSEHHDVGCQARARLNSYRCSADEVAIGAEVEPYWSSGEAIHSREISLSKSGEVSVHDQVSGHGTHQLQWLLHFAPDLEVELIDAATIIAKRKDEVLVCELRGPGPAPALRVVRGEAFPTQGWVATSSARVAPAWVLVAEVKAAMPYALQFQFTVSSRRNDPTKLSGSHTKAEVVAPELAGAVV